ncbi:hypothetical protein FACS1894202_07370 [Clostridia bacterium]|nr:hypothetical protein FACS1894202_07370 [Clostridia bacterium]
MNKLNSSTAAALIRERYGEHMTTESLKAWLRSGRCPFGEYVIKRGKKRGGFLFSRERMDAYYRPRYGWLAAFGDVK